MRDGYQATYAGVVYEASPDGELMRLYSTEPTEGFARINDRRYRRVVRGRRGRRLLLRTHHVPLAW